MAKLYGEIAASALMTFDKSFARANGQPLDSTEIYYSLAAAEEYAAGAGAYVGQKIVVIENDVITHYSIEDEAGTLKELGSKSIGDGDTISIAEDGTISLAGIGEDQASGTWNAVLVNGKLTWVEPSATTVEGLDTRLKSLESEVGDPASDTTDATGLYLAIANSIQEAKDYADANDTDTTYTLSYADSNPDTTVTGNLVSDGTYLVALNRLTIPDNVDEIKISNDIQSEVIGFTSSSVSFITPTAPEFTTSYQVTGYADGMPTGYSVEVTYMTASGSTSTVYDVVGVTIPEDVTEVTSTTEGKILWNAGDTTVKFAGDYTNGVDIQVTYTTSSHKVIKLTGSDGTATYIDATPFIKDGMLHDVEYDAESNTLTFIWNTDSGEKTDTVVLSDIIDPYTAGNGIEIANNVISTKIDSTSEYLSVGADGIKVSGINDAISTAVSSESDRATAAESALGERITDLEAIDHTQYATNTTLEEVRTTANNAAAKADTLEDKIEEITSVGGEPNTIDYVQMNGNTLPVTDKTVNIGIKQNGIDLTVTDGAVNITTPTKVSDLTDDGDWGTKITTAQTTADNAVTAANGAQSTADSALEKANANASEITKLQNADATHQAEYNTLAELVNGHTTTIAGKADTTTVDTLTTRVATNETDIKTLKETTIPGLEAQIGNKANSSEVYTRTEIGTITEGKTLVDMINEAKSEATYDDSEIRALITAEETRATGVEAGLNTRLEKVETFFAAVETPDETIDTLAEIVSYIESDESGAATMAANIKSNTDAIAAINNTDTGILATANAYTDDAIAALLIKTVDDKTIQNVDGTISVKAISTDLLTQGENEFILNGGSATK